MDKLSNCICGHFVTQDNPKFLSELHTYSVAISRTFLINGLLGVLNETKLVFSMLIVSLFSIAPSTQLLKRQVHMICQYIQVILIHH